MKILYIDIENSPNVGEMWQLWNVNFGLNQVREWSKVICFSAMWSDEEDVMFYSVYHDGYETMLTAAYDLLDEADIVVHFNGKRFDIPVLMKEFLLGGFPPPSPFEQVDLYQEVKRVFRFTSNKLDHIVQMLGLGAKEQTGGHSLWTRCMQNDPEAWALMEKYSKQDTALLPQLHLRLRGWIREPNARLYFSGDTEHMCPACGNFDLVKEGYAYSATGKYQRWHCKDCGKWSKSSRREDGEEISGA